MRTTIYDKHIIRQHHLILRNVDGNILRQYLRLVKRGDPWRNPLPTWRFTRIIPDDQQRVIFPEYRITGNAGQKQQKKQTVA